MSHETKEEYNERKKKEQQSHHHSSSNLMPNVDRFAGCGCGWCYVCDNPPHECCCEDKPDWDADTILRREG